MLPSVNGKWSAWSSFTSCSVTCGSGVGTRVRSCDNPSPMNGGIICPGSASESVDCNPKPCRKFKDRI